MIAEIPNSTSMIKYDVMINRSNNYTFPEISFDDVDKYDFTNNGFIEVLKAPEYVHLYFDFDKMKTDNEDVSDEEQMNRFADVICWLDSLKPIFGEYSIGGYTDNEAMHAKYHLRFYPEGHHFSSIHVVFYETCIKSEDLVDIMKHTDKQGFLCDGINQFADPNVYKITVNKDGRGGTQKFRHVLSNKIFTNNTQDKKNYANNKYNHGTIINDTKPSQQIIQTRGDELIIERDEWEKVFKPRTLKEARDETKLRQIVKSVTNEEPQKLQLAEACSLDYVVKLIDMSNDDFDDLLSNFACEFDNLKIIGSILLHSPLDKERVRDILSRWYFTREHTNTASVDMFVDKYYSQENNNKWFYSIVKRIDNESIRNQWLDKFKSNIDEEATINVKDKLGISEIREKNYKLPGGIGVNISMFLNDLKHVVAFISGARSLFIVKDYDAKKKTYKLSYLEQRQFRELMESINLGKYYKEGKLKDVNGWMVYTSGNNKNVLKKRGCNFYDTDPDIFNVFCGYDYQQVDEINDSRVQLWLNHIKEVLANNDESVSEFIINWFAYILQNPGNKTCSCLVFTGDEGCGKTIVSNLFSKLLGIYAEKNITNIDDICGKFNAVLENKKLIVCNELATIDNNKSFNADIMKSIITEDSIVINEKNEPKRTAENVANFILISNDSVPIRISRNDRRYCICECSSKYANNQKYFAPLYESLDDESFMNQIFTFFMKRDISGFNPRVIPQTKAKRDVLDFTKSQVELYIESTVERFDIEGENCEHYYKRYKQFAADNGFGAMNANNFGKEAKRYITKRRVRIYGQLENRYFLNEDFKQQVLDNNTVDIDFDAMDEHE